MYTPHLRAGWVGCNQALHRLGTATDALRLAYIGCVFYTKPLEATLSPHKTSLNQHKQKPTSSATMQIEQRNSLRPIWSVKCVSMN